MRIERVQNPKPNNTKQWGQALSNFWSNDISWNFYWFLCDNFERSVLSILNKHLHFIHIFEKFQNWVGISDPTWRIVAVSYTLPVFHEKVVQWFFSYKGNLHTQEVKQQHWSSTTTKVSSTKVTFHGGRKTLWYVIDSVPQNTVLAHAIKSLDFVYVHRPLWLKYFTAFFACFG